MAQTFLQQLGQGLRIAGSTTSNENFQAFNRQNELQANRDQEGKMFAAGLIIRGMENGVIGPEGADMLQKLGLPGAYTGKAPQIQKMEAEREAERLRMERRSVFPQEVKAVEDNVFGTFAADAPDGIEGTELQDFSDSTSPVSDVTTPDVDVLGKENPLDDPFKRREAAAALDDLAIKYDTEGDSDLADAARAKAKVHRDRADALEKLQDPGKESENEAKIRRYEEIGVPRKEAIKLVQGAYKIATDPFGRDYIYDLVEKRRVTELDPVASKMRQEQQEETRASVDFEAATGVSGGFKRSMNLISGLFGGGLVFEDAEKATNALEQLRIETIAVGEAKIPGRPSNFQLQLIDSLTINPRNILIGDAKALQKLRDTRNWLQREVDRMYDVVLGKPREYSPKELSMTANNVSQMEAVVREYNWAIDQMETKGKPRRSMDEIDKDLK